MAIRGSANAVSLRFATEDKVQSLRFFMENDGTWAVNLFFWAPAVRGSFARCDLKLAYEFSVFFPVYPIPGTSGGARPC